MNIFTPKRSILTICAAFLTTAMLQSCGGGATSMSNKDIAELQKQLDSTMQMYHRVKAQNTEYDKQMASRDSAINAQAAEIQSLIDQLNGKQPAKVQTVANVDQKKLDQQQKEIRDKENKIKTLQKQIDQQSQQIKKLQSGSSNSQGKDNSSQYKSQITKLQKQISDQEKQIKNLRAEADRLKKNNNSKSTNCDDVRNTYESKVKQLNGEIGGYKTQIADLHKQIKSLKAEVSTLQKGSANDSKDAEDLKAARKELTSMTAQLNECRKLSSQYQNDVKEITANLNQTRGDLERCQSELAAEEAKVKSLQNTQSEGGKTEQQLRADLAALTTKEAALRTQRDELTKSYEELSQQCDKDKKQLQNTIEKLQTRVSDMQGRVDQLTSENSTLKKKQNESSASEDAATVAKLSAQVESQRAEIAKLQADLKQRDADLAAARAAASKNTQQTTTKGNVNQKLAELQALCDSYVAEIERLRAENEQLKTENADLKNKVASSSELFAENERLQQKVKLASVLVTSDLKVTPGKSVKTGNVVKATDKASQVKVIRIDGRLLDNNVVDPGSITIYARIATANNRVICNGSAENYSFDLNGVSMQYTTKQDIEFTGYGRTITMLWRKSDAVELAPGLYWVTLYANGYEIGKISFRLN